MLQEVDEADFAGGGLGTWASWAAPGRWSLCIAAVAGQLHDLAIRSQSKSNKATWRPTKVRGWWWVVARRLVDIDGYWTPYDWDKEWFNDKDGQGWNIEWYWYDDCKWLRYEYNSVWPTAIWEIIPAQLLIPLFGRCYAARDFHRWIMKWTVRGKDLDIVRTCHWKNLEKAKKCQVGYRMLSGSRFRQQKLLGLADAARCSLRPLQALTVVAWVRRQCRLLSDITRRKGLWRHRP